MNIVIPIMIRLSDSCTTRDLALTPTVTHKPYLPVAALGWWKGYSTYHVHFAGNGGERVDGQTDHLLRCSNYSCLHYWLSEGCNDVSSCE